MRHTTALSGRKFAFRMFTVTADNFQARELTLPRLRDLLASSLELDTLPSVPVTDGAGFKHPFARRPDLDWRDESKWAWCWLYGDPDAGIGDVVDAGEWMCWGFRVWAKTVPPAVRASINDFELREAARRMNCKLDELPADTRAEIKLHTSERLMRQALPTIATVPVCYNVRTGRLVVMTATASTVDAVIDAFRPVAKHIWGKTATFVPLTLDGFLAHTRGGAPLPTGVAGMFIRWLLHTVRRTDTRYLVVRDERTHDLQRVAGLLLGDRIRAKENGEGDGVMELRGSAMDSLRVVDVTDPAAPDEEADAPPVPLSLVDVLQLELEVRDFSDGDDNYTVRIDQSGLVASTDLAKSDYDAINTAGYESDDIATAATAGAILRLAALERVAALQVALWTAFDLGALAVHFAQVPYLPLWPHTVGALVTVEPNKPYDLAEVLRDGDLRKADRQTTIDDLRRKYGEITVTVSE